MAARGSRRCLCLAVAGTAADGRESAPGARFVDGVGRLWLTLVFRQGHPRRLALRLLADGQSAVL
jgi:hypothetical protein